VRQERPERPSLGRTPVGRDEPADPGPARAARRGADRDEPEAAEARREEPPVSAAAAGTSAQPRRKGRGRRASVPSWDEIMFGSKKTD
jgi:hypothetical protein